MSATATHFGPPSLAFSRDRTLRPMDDLRARVRDWMRTTPVDDVETVVVARQWVDETRELVQRLLLDLEEVERVLDRHQIPGGHLRPCQRVELLIERYHGAHFTRESTKPKIAPLSADDVIDGLLDDDDATE